MTTAFPAAAAAVAECGEALAAVLAASAAVRETGRHFTAALRVAERRQQAAQERARAAYAAELLPAVLGGSWRLARRWNWPAALFRRDEWRLLDLHVLFDHALVFRQRGTRGPLTWRDAAAVGMPYNALDRDGLPLASAVAVAGRLIELGIGVWVRPDLSAWFPGRTQLVLAAPDLLALDPERFGFRALGNPGCDRGLPGPENRSITGHCADTAPVMSLKAARNGHFRHADLLIDNQRQDEVRSVSGGGA